MNKVIYCSLLHSYVFVLCELETVKYKAGVR